MIRRASMHSLASSYMRMLSRAFILLMVCLRLQLITERVGILLPFVRAFPLYLYLFIDFIVEDSLSLSRFQTTLVRILKRFCKIFSCALFVSFYSSCPSLILIAALLLNSHCCTNPLQIPSLIFRNILGYAWDPGSKGNNIPSYSLGQFKTFRDHNYCHSSAIGTPDFSPVAQKSLTPAGERMMGC